MAELPLKELITVKHSESDAADLFKLLDLYLSSGLTEEMFRQDFLDPADDKEFEEYMARWSLTAPEGNRNDD
jgi:hypothetical protein